jgi:bacteriorhodopsin
MDISKEELITNTFYITYVFLITTGTITFIESLRTKEEKVRNILNLETCISVIAAFFYGKFVKDLDKGIDYKKINETRYVDWAITTPIMLLVLVLAFLFNNKEGALSFSKYLVILVLNYAMLGFGYVGELGLMDKTTSNGLGFVAFAGMYYYIYQNYIKGRNNNDNLLLYSLFVFLWALYGVFYFFDSVTRNIGYNVLDLFSKCFVGIFFWAYYTKVFKLP